METNSEQNADYIKRQRKAIVKAVSDVVAIITIENLKPHFRPKYHIEFSTGMSGNNADLRIYKGDELVENIDVWLLSSAFESSAIFFSKERTQQECDRIQLHFQIMKQLCIKYSKLNENE